MCQSVSLNLFGWNGINIFNIYELNIINILCFYFQQETASVCSLCTDSLSSSLWPEVVAEVHRYSSQSHYCWCKSRSTHCLCRTLDFDCLECSVCLLRSCCCSCCCCSKPKLMILVLLGVRCCGELELGRVWVGADLPVSFWRENGE